MSYVISYDYLGTTNGHPVGRVYVTGPHFGENTFSHTYDPNKAAAWSRREDAERELSRRHWPNASVVDLRDAQVLGRPQIAAAREP